MKITKTDIYVTRPVQGKSRSARSRKSTGGDAAVQGSGDHVGLSEKARLMGEIKQALLDSDDVRLDKVAHYRELISKGEYVINSDKIAEKMLKEVL